jgi:hypothetical protein
MRYKKNRRSKKDKFLDMEIHIPQSQIMMKEASKLQLLACIDKIQKAKAAGELSTYILASSHHDLTEENRSKLLEAGYDLSVKHFTHMGELWFIHAKWDQHCTENLLMKNNFTEGG